MSSPERSLELNQCGIPDTSKGRPERKEPGRVRHDAQAVSVEGRAHGGGVDLARVSGGRLQRQVHEVKAVSPKPVDLCQWVPCRVIHGTDLHGKPSFTGASRSGFPASVLARLLRV